MALNFDFLKAKVTYSPLPGHYVTFNALAGVFKDGRCTFVVEETKPDGSVNYFSLSYPSDHCTIKADIPEAVVVELRKEGVIP